MKKGNKLYIAYGSNLNRMQMAWRCPTAKVIGATAMEGCRLLFRGARTGAVATVEPHAGRNVPVLAWEITPADEAALDHYEGFPYLYRKENAMVRLNGKTVTAMVYVMNTGTAEGTCRPLGQPDPYYYATILKGYKDAGFDAEILRQATEDSAESEASH